MVRWSAWQPELPGHLRGLRVGRRPGCRDGTSDGRMWPAMAARLVL